MFISIFIFTGCSTVSEDLLLAVCGSYAVPGMVCWDLKDASFSCKVLERDSENRVLFLYQTTSLITGQLERQYVICQKASDRHVFFYEDLCYFPASCIQDMDTFKNINDWNQPLDESRMSRRDFQISFDLFIVSDSQLEYNKSEKACCEALGIDSSQLQKLLLLDVNPAGQELLLLTVIDNTSEKAFLAVVDTDYSVTYVSADQNPMEQVRVLKQESSWVYSQ